MFIVIISQSNSSKEIFVLDSLFYLKISVEAYQCSSPSHCFSCQRVGHGSQNFGHVPRCIKFAGNHSIAKCIKLRETLPTCCNCSGAYTANFCGCSYLAKFATSTAQTSGTDQQPTPPTQNVFAKSKNPFTIFKTRHSSHTSTHFKIVCCCHKEQARD